LIFDIYRYLWYLFYDRVFKEECEISCMWAPRNRRKVLIGFHGAWTFELRSQR
jgi:hypothetical protein